MCFLLKPILWGIYLSNSYDNEAVSKLKRSTVRSFWAWKICFACTGGSWLATGRVYASMDDRGAHKAHANDERQERYGLAAEEAFPQTRSTKSPEFVQQMELTEDTSCGIGCVREKWLQTFATDTRLRLRHSRLLLRVLFCILQWDHNHHGEEV